MTYTLPEERFANSVTHRFAAVVPSAIKQVNGALVMSDITPAWLTFRTCWPVIPVVR